MHNAEEKIKIALIYCIKKEGRGTCGKAQNKLLVSAFRVFSLSASQREIGAAIESARH